MAGVALGSTGHIAAATVSAIVAQHLGGSTVWAGVPGAAVVLGAAAGAVVLANLMVRRGRRFGLGLGYVIGVAGALIAILAVIAGSLAWFIAGTILIGFGNASNQLSRYTAADLYPEERRASSIGIVVWGATVGAVLGPNLVAPTGAFAVSIGLPELAGPYLVPMLFVGATAVLSSASCGPTRTSLPTRPRRRRSTPRMVDRWRPCARSCSVPNVAVAAVALVVGQVVMVLIMTMTPLHMTQHGHTLTDVGLVLSATRSGCSACRRSPGSC